MNEKRKISFPDLNNLLQVMGASYISWDSGKTAKQINISINAVLATTGIEVDIADLTVDDNGIFMYEGQRVFLYIKDTMDTKDTVLNYPQDTKKYHFSNCDTLQKMKKNKRFERYVAIKRYDGLFPVNTQNDRFNPTQFEENVEAPLNVCKVCLRNINYQNYAHCNQKDKQQIFKAFNISEFFETYEATTHIAMPKYTADTAPISQYSKDWSSVSSDFREKKRWECEQCKVNLSKYKNLLHTHHINGRKEDNRYINLKCLCAICHSQEPNHEHMKVSIGDKAIILSSRKKGNI